MIRRIGFVVALVLLLLSPAFAQQEDDLDSIRERAEKGEATAQFNLGLRLYRATLTVEDIVRKYGGVPLEPSKFKEYGNDQEAVKWFRKAAEQGYAPAQHKLGFMYEYGKGVRQQDQEAIKWFRKAAEQGYTPAQVDLGLMYCKGVPQHDQEAVKWYRKAAEQGYAPAQHNLGLMLWPQHGFGHSSVPQDYVQAHMWFNLAASQLTGKDRDDAVMSRDLLAKEMTREQILEAQRLAREWKPKGAKVGE